MHLLNSSKHVWRRSNSSLSLRESGDRLPERNTAHSMNCCQQDLNGGSGAPVSACASSHAKKRRHASTMTAAARVAPAGLVTEQMSSSDGRWNQSATSPIALATEQLGSNWQARSTPAANPMARARPGGVRTIQVNAVPA